MDPIQRLSAVRLARRIRSGEISAVEAVECHIAAIQAVNPRLNAVVRDRFEPARVEAKQADARVRQGGELPPLLGVPCTIKESIALEGMPQTSGMVSRSGMLALHDAPPVARLRAAGAIPLGVTNVSELTVWTATFNNVYGQTNNAYAADRIAGGSSGGEGAIVGAGASPFGIGTDIGGSIRIPAFCNGVFGHKPSGGLVPGTGQIPAYAGEVVRKNTTGPIARRAEDLMPVLRIIAGPDGEDAGCRAMALGDPASVDIQSVRVLVMDGDGGRARVSEELRHAQQRAAYTLARCGAAVEMASLRALRRSQSIAAGTILAAGGVGIETALAEGRPDGRPVGVWAELARLAIGRSAHTFPPLILGIGSRLASRWPAWAARNAERGRMLRERFEMLLGHDAVLLYPTALRTAPPHGVAASAPFRFTGIFNALELPVTQVPLGLGADGLPLGIQVVGAHGCDHLTIAVALELESALGGWVPPSSA